MSAAKARTGPPVVLTIAGSDNSGGAGIQADLKTISALGGYALTAVTCVVAEVPGRVVDIQAVRPHLVAEQIRLSFEAFPVAAVKTGMLYSTGIIRAVHRALLEATYARKIKVPLVIDPVMVASSGDALLKDSAVAAYRRDLFPIATLITPNVDELAVLAGVPISDLDAMRAAGLQLAEACGAAVLLKGGHLRGEMATDILVSPDGQMEEYAEPFVLGADPHGTGCTYSAAIATGLAHGQTLREAVSQGKKHITKAIQGRWRWGTTEVLHPL